ncbi:MBG domain-containing protein, partial [Pseudoxanthomonas spadix]|uniref:two-partner secretion domain-containing protein n=1 Tax=Pseudoxanthomonas spadix TaxID=415229 RepID=UPI001FD3419C
MAAAADLPTGGTVVAGEGGIASNGTAMTITQSSAKLAIDWRSFDIGAGNSVNFHQPDRTSIALNRVTGSDPSSLYGTLTANGRVFLINPNGILFGAGASVNVGALVASTLGLSNEEFLAGAYRFKGDGANASVINRGTLSAADGGAVALLGGAVSNQGLIVARLGTVALASGNRVTLDFAGDGLLNVQVDQATTSALVDNQQLVQAEGGQVIMTAQASDALLQTVVNNSGVVEAKALGEKDGRIALLGGDTGTVRLTGTLDASSNVGQGGTIEVTGQQVALHGATLDASGAADGGSIKVGGDYRGGGDLRHAEATLIDAASTLKADATQAGDGGQVVVWSERGTQYGGSISARGKGDGAGGSAEVSSHGVLDFTGQVDLTAETGASGTLLLDPYNLTIGDELDSDWTYNSGTYTPLVADSQLAVSHLLTNLATADIVVQTTGTGGSQAGDITVAVPVSWASNHSLTLRAAGGIRVNADITATGDTAGLVLSHGAGMGYTLADGARITLSGATALLKIGETGSEASYSIINSLSALQAIGDGASGHYALGVDIDARDTVNWNGGAGFVPLAQFGGVLDGLGHTIDGLHIDHPSANTGLIGDTANFVTQVRNLGLVDVNITGGSRVGGLIGRSNGATVDNVFVTGQVTGSSDYVGGLIGQSDQGRVSNSHADVGVTVASGTVASGVGGLLGMSRLGNVSNVYATGDVHAPSSNYVGGLVGQNAFLGYGQGSFISAAYATGNVHGDNAVGGLIGVSEGADITGSWSLGNVSGRIAAGGLVGSLSGSVQRSTSGSAVSGESILGGLVGDLAASATVTDAYATGSVTGMQILGGLVGQAGYGATINTSYASGAVSASGTATGGLVGFTNTQFSVNDSFWDIDSTGQAGTAVSSGPGTGAVGIRTSNAFDPATYAGFDFTNTWWATAGNTRPLLRSEYSTTISNAHQLQLMALDLTADYRLGAQIDLTATASGGGSDIWSSAGFDPVGDAGSAFTGSLDGQGHVIDGLTINRSGDAYVGLFGRTGTGSSIADLGLEGVSVTGGDITGGLVGENNGGSIAGSHVSGSVAGGSSVGSLVGYNTGGSVLQSYAVGSVQGWQSIGGLVGNNSGGSIAESFATNSVAGGYYYVGGLAGVNTSGGTITDAYAMGRVSGFWDVGGLVGYNLGGTVTNAYATGMTSKSGGGGLGGLIGYSGSVSNGYWDSGTSGIGGGMTTGELQSALPGGFSASTWGQIAGRSYPYLLWQFPSGATPQVISGTVRYAGGTAVANTSVSGLVDGAPLQSALTGGGVSSGANGYYYFLLEPGTLDNSQVLTHYAAGATFQDGVGASLQNFDIDQDVLRVTTSAASWSGIRGVLNSDTSVASLIAGLNTLDLTASGSFSLDDQVDARDVALDVAGDLAIDTALNVDGLRVSATGIISDTASVDAGVFTLAAGTWRQVGTLPDFAAVDFRLAGGTFIRALAGNGGGAMPYQIADVYGLQGIGSSGMLGSAYVLANDIDASGTTAWNANQGFNPLGSDLDPFTGSLNGQGHVIDGLTINRPMLYGVGLFGYVGVGGVLDGLGLTGGSIRGGQYVGGLVGYNLGNVTDSYASATLDAAWDDGGGLIGHNGGTLERVYADGVVSGRDSVGGLVGYNDGTGLIRNAYSSTTVNARANFIGGLAGKNRGTVQYAYANGHVSGNYEVGGLFGENSGTISSSFWDLQLTGRDGAVGHTVGDGIGMTGLTTAQMHQIDSFDGWSIDDMGGTTSVWRLYEGHTSPLLRSFLSPVTVTADLADASKTYDGEIASGTTTYTLDPGVDTGLLLGGDTLAYATSSGNAGVYSATDGSLSLGEGLYSTQQGYDLRYEGSLSIGKAGLTITANDASKTYGQSASLTGYTASGLVNGDAVSSVDLSSAGAASTATVGNYTITAANADGTGLSNYAISYVDGTLTVGKAGLTITASDASKTYGQSASLTGYTASGLVNGDTVSSVDLSSAGAASTATVGNYTITAANADGTGLSNYAISYVDGTLTVGKAGLTITASDASKTYGQSASLTGYTASGLVNG